MCTYWVFVMCIEMWLDSFGLKLFAAKMFFYSNIL